MKIYSSALSRHDSHEYGEAISPFDKAEINRLVLDYLRSFLCAPDLQIVERWHGVYLNHPSSDCWIARPHASVTLIGSPGGEGMTVSFGVAEQVVRENLGEA